MAIKFSQELLLSEIFKNYGGSSAVAKLVGIRVEIIHNAKNSKYGVPLKHVGKIARALGLSIYALDYEGVTQLLGQAPPWDTVVKDCELSKIKEDEILAAKHPKKVKDLL